MAQTPYIDPAEVWKQLESKGDCIILDVRTPVEHRQLHPRDAAHLPLQQLTVEEARRFAEEYCSGKALYVICKSGARSCKAAEIFEQAGVPIAGVIDGGTDQWVKAGLPVVRDTKVLSLERQVRLAVGIPVALFSLLAILIHPWFAVLPLLFGCGLTVAGATDWCGMALFLSRMPWNQGDGGARTSCSVKGPERE